MSLKWNDFLRFRKELRDNRRYIRTECSNDYLEAIKQKCKKRITTISKGTELWRARQDGIEVPCSPDDWTIQEYACNEMTAPPQNLSGDSRIGVQGIPVLYLSSDKETAMSEVRPWKGQPVSLARVCPIKDLIIVDFQKNTFDGSVADLDKLFPLSSIMRGKPLTDSDHEEIAWAWIDHSFSKSISQQDAPLEYLPTQVIAELIKTEEYDGIKYNSSVASGHNIAIFDVNIAEVLDTKLYYTNDICYRFSKHQFPKSDHPKK